VQLAAEAFKADLALLDVGPNLGALNRCAVIASDHVAVPLVPDLFSLQGLRNLGPTLRKWRNGWSKRRDEAPDTVKGLLPQGGMQPAGYVVLQHAVRQSRPVKAYSRWAQRIPVEYQTAMMLPGAETELLPETDPNCLAQLKHYRSLMPLAMEARKPMFHLKPADGAIGGHVEAVSECAKDFRRLAVRLAKATGLVLPTQSEV
jgi:cellulose biosynthesis protein BcsQ